MFNIKNFDIENQLCFYCNYKFVHLCINNTINQYRCSKSNKHIVINYNDYGHITCIYVDKHIDSYYIYIHTRREILNIKISKQYDYSYFKQFFVGVTEITDYEKLKLLIEKIYKMIELE